MYRPIVLKNADLILGSEGDGTDFGLQLTSITATPDVATERIKTVKPEGRFASVDDPEWSLDLGYLYGYDDAGAVEQAFSSYLLMHNGEIVPFIFRPLHAVAGSPEYTGEVHLVAGPLGGDQGAFSTQTVSLPVEGQVAVGAIGSTETFSATATETSPDVAPATGT